MYASHLCSGSANIFQNVHDNLLQKSNLPFFSIGDCPPLSPIGISTATSIPDPTPFNVNRKTVSCETSETTASDINFAVFKNSETLDGDVNLAVSSLLTHVRNSVQTENASTQNQISNIQLAEQNISNAANDSFHSVGEEPSPCHQQHALETVEMEAPVNETFSSFISGNYPAAGQRALTNEASNLGISCLNTRGTCRVSK